MYLFFQRKCCYLGKQYTTVTKFEGFLNLEFEETSLPIDALFFF